MSNKPDTIEHLLEKYQAALSETNERRAAEPALRADVDQLVAELSGVDPRLLIVSPKEPGELPAAVASKLAKLTVARSKLEILPGLVSRSERDAAKIAEQMDIFLRRSMDAIRSETRARIEALRSRYAAEFEEICGHDARRHRAALDALIENSEAARWLKEFHGITIFPVDPVARGRRFLKVVEVFKTGGTLSNAFH